LIIPGIVFHITALLIIGASLGALAFLCLFFGFIAPLSMIAIFELYYNLCAIRNYNVIVDEVLDKKRKRKLVGSIVIGIIASVLIILAIFAAIVLVNINQYVQKAKKAEILSSSNNIFDIVQQIKANAKFPVKIDDAITLTDITAEPGAIRYYFTITTVDKQLDEQQGIKMVKDNIVPIVCGGEDEKILLNRGINLEYSYTVEKTQQNFLISITKADCPVNP